MKDRKIVLASKSPRRKRLLEQIGLEFEIRESEYEEDMEAKSDPFELCKFLALGKGQDVARHFDDAIIISADTFAFLPSASPATNGARANDTIFNNKFIGQPKDEEDAKNILRNFSGQEHSVVTGFAVIDTKSGKIINDYGEAKVKFRNLSDEEIDNYIATGEPMDMAGAYGLMNKGAVLIESIEGDFYSVIGLPLAKVYVALKDMRVDLLKY
ncbi:MAG: nucleoside triphosphate pyrophosphatase [Patescibacteria group bacterium]